MAKAKSVGQRENKVSQESGKDSAQAKSKQDGPIKSMPREVVEILMYGLSLLFFCKGFVWQNFQIPTSSMENTLLIGDHITANTFIYKPSFEFERKILPFRDVLRGDIVVFKFPGNPREDWIKRCVGIPGDQWALIADQVYINGNKLDEPYPFFKEAKFNNSSDRDPEIAYRPRGYYTLKPGLDFAVHREKVDRDLKSLLSQTKQKLRAYRQLDLKTYEPIMKRLVDAESHGQPVIPAGFYLMMGDNRNRSFDSREWGLVPREFIQGKAFFLWWSYGEDEGSHKLSGGKLLMSYLRVPFVFFQRTHWDKTFTRIR